MVCQPQYLLFCDSNLSLPVTSDGNCEPLVGQGTWHFVLERLDGPERLEAMDTEPSIHRDRIALLSVIRGLEALEHPSHVRLVTSSRYVDRGLRFGLPNWRDANYLWESFGALKPIRNADLWRRITSAMLYHEISCRMLKSSNELVESLIGSRGRLPQVDHALAHSGGGTQVQTSEQFPAQNRRRLSLEAQSQRHTSPSQLAPTLASSRAPLPVRPQWWDMAAAWVETVQGSPAMAH